VPSPLIFRTQGREANLREATMTLRLLVSIAEDGPWCGTRPPGRPHPPHFREAMLRTAGELSGPIPDPWRLGMMEVGLYGAISLHQLGRSVSGPAAEG